MSTQKVFPIFAAAFAVIYLLSVQYNWALFTYHPKIDEWQWLAQRPKNGPPMYWYGWLVTSLLGASAVSLISWPLTRRWTAQLWLGWMVPIVIVVIFVYLFRSFFLR